MTLNYVSGAHKKRYAKLQVKINETRLWYYN